MITKLRIRNCLSFKDLTIRFSRLNVLVGENASGKSNLCHILQFLKLSPMVGDLSEAFLRAAGANAMFNHIDIDPEKNNSHFNVECVIPHNGEKLSYTYDLEIKRGGNRLIGTELSVVREKLTSRKKTKKEEVILFENKDGLATILREKSSSKRRSDYITEKIQNNRTMLSEIIDSEEYISANLFKKFLSTIFHFDPMLEHLKDMTFYPSVFFIECRGKNLFYSINQIKNDKYQEYNNNSSGTAIASKTKSNRKDTNELWEGFIERIRLLDENICDIELNEEALRQNFTIPDFYNGNGNKYGIDSLSSGTLRAMGILVASIRAEKIRMAIGVTPTVSIEEPENGIHVGLLRMLYDGFKKSTGQYILTTHSPYLIDLFEDNLDGVKCFKKVNNETKLIKLDKKRIKNILEEMPLGEMHFRGILGK